MTDHYFSTQPTVQSKPRTLVVSLAGRELSVTTDAGIFSPTRIDPGTQVLLKHLPPPERGNILDLGCGWGPISLQTGLEAARDGVNSTVWALDVNARALELTAHNATNNGLSNIKAVTAAEVPTDVTFAQIFSNPPIRVGKSVLHELLLSWLPRLVPGASAWLVVSKNLGAGSLATWMAGELPVATGETGWTVEKVASAKGFRVLKVTRPRF